MNGVGDASGSATSSVNQFVGDVLGRNDATSDYEASRDAFTRASQMSVGNSVYWQNGRTGHWGYYCAIRDGHARYNGDYCREYMSTVYMNRKCQKTRGTACRTKNGEWYDE